MKPLQHLKYSLAAAGIVFIASKNLKSTLGCVISGVLVDLDHLIEYQNYCRGRWDWKEFSTGTYFNKKGTVKVIFHSWEAAVLLWVIILFKKRKFKTHMIYGIAVGYVLHLILDQIGNNMKLMGYFELYRWHKNWQQDKLIIED